MYFKKSVLLFVVGVHMCYVVISQNIHA